MPTNRTIIGTVSADNIVGRRGEIDAIVRHVTGAGDGRGLLVFSPPGSGRSELLKQIYDRIFAEQDKVIPFYFAFRESDRTARAAATRFVQELILQTVAFRRRNPDLLNFGGDVGEIAEIAIPGDTHWIDRLLETCRLESRLNDERAFIRTALGAPIRAGGNGARIVPIIEDLEIAARLSGEVDIVEEFCAVFSRLATPFVVGCNRRFACSIDGGKVLRLEPLPFADAGELVERLCAKRGLEVSPEARDLIAVQLGGRPRHIAALVETAVERKTPLLAYSDVQKVYADSIFGGCLAAHFDAVIGRALPDPDVAKSLTAILFDTLTMESRPGHLEDWKRRLAIGDAKFGRAVAGLNISELISVTTNLVEPERTDVPFSDYVEARFRLETANQNRALTFAEALAGYIKRAPLKMAEFYREHSALGLREVLASFDGRVVPRLLLDYGAFRDELKGAPSEEIAKALGRETDTVQLPKIVFTTRTESVYPPIGQFLERSRSAVGIGFTGSRYADEDETVWIAAEIDSKLEATRELTEFWCDRLEMVAVVSDFRNVRFWLVAPEGFTPEALDVLAERGAFGSNRRQVELLIGTLGLRDETKIPASEYEMVVPMGDDTEIIAAQTVEEIARRHDFPAKAINQIKTALVEACINATEHGHSPDRKIYQKFAVEDDRITITVSNRGLRLSDRTPREANPTAGRRGWGLKLMKSLMDEVRIEDTDDGTRVRMVKMRN